MEFRYYCYDNYGSNHLLSKKINQMKLIITLIIILGLIALFYYLKKLKTVIANLFPWLVKNKK